MTDAKAERERLISANNEEITPVDYVQVRRKRRQVCVGVAIVCCLGVGLSLAVAIPLVGQQPASGTAADGAQVPNGKLMMSAGDGFRPRAHTTPPAPVTATEDQQSAVNVTTAETSTTEEHTTHRRHHPTWPTWPTEWTRRTMVPRRTTTLTTTTPPTSTTASWLPVDCPRAPHTSWSPADLKDLVGHVWYEVRRIQTFNTPAYVDHVSCSTLTVNATETDPVLDAEVLLSWEEGQTFSRYRKQVTLHLHRNDSESSDWIETTSENAEMAQFSFLARLDSFLLTYECFPTVRWFPAPGYIIRVLSRNPAPAQYDDRIADVMLYLTERWHLNPALVSPTTVRQRFCDLNIGHE